MLGRSDKTHAREPESSQMANPKPASKPSQQQGGSATPSQQQGQQQGGSQQQQGQQPVFRDWASI